MLMIAQMQLARSSRSEGASNVILNGTFDSTANWVVTSPASISGGVLSAPGIIGAFIRQDDRLVSGATYSFSLSRTTSTSSRILVGCVGGTLAVSPLWGAGSGTYSSTFVAAASGDFVIEGDDTYGFVGTIDNIVVTRIS